MANPRLVITFVNDVTIIGHNITFSFCLQNDDVKINLGLVTISFAIIVIL